MNPEGIDLEGLAPLLLEAEGQSIEDRILAHIAEVIRRIDDPANLIILKGMAKEVFKDLEDRFGISAAVPGPETPWRTRRAFHLHFWIRFGIRVIDPELDRSRVSDIRALEEASAYLEFLQDLALAAEPDSAPLAERVGQVLFGMPTFWTQRT